MAMERLRCINPRCRRTGRPDSEATEVCCGKCWRRLPLAFRKRDRELRSKFRKMERRVLARRSAGTIDDATADRVMLNVQRAWLKNWNMIRLYFTSPELPEGLERFLEEMGWAA